VWLRVRATSRLGPVEVEALSDDDSTPAAPIQGPTADLRERLANSGLLPPPAVPAGSPQTDVISAIEASNISQGAFIAKILELIPWPRPVAYKLGGTLRASEGEKGARFSFWLRSTTAEGGELLDTVDGPDYEEAVQCAADKVFMYVSSHAVDVFPSWARWYRLDAFQCYREGLKASDEEKARPKFEKAKELEPRNLLPKLKLVNLDERTAVNEGDVLRQADVLRDYLNIAVERPTLVEPRYRASILASVLARMLVDKGEDLPKQDREAIAESVGLNPAEPAAEELRALAALETDAVMQMLRAWYVPLRHLRLRHRYEPAGTERRLLKRAVAISRHCQAVRARLKPKGLFAAVQLRLRRALVWLVHLQLGRATVSWQAEYNAACFYALLDERTNEIRKGTSERIRRAAFRYLNRAIDSDPGELSSKWLGADPDLESLRIPEGDEWRLILARLEGTTVQVARRPARPWGSPRRRRAVAAGLAAVCILGIAAVALTQWAWWFAAVLAAAAVFALWRSWRIHLEIDVEDMERADG
jgi:hypothetical protein